MFITKTELKLYFNKSIVLCTIILALLSLIVGLLGDNFLYKNKFIPKFTLYIVNNDNSAESKMLVESIKAFKIDTMHVLESDEATANIAIKGGEASAALIIPKNFFNDILTGVNSDAELRVNNTNESVSKIIKLFAYSIKEQLSAAQAGIYYVLSYAGNDAEKYQKYMTDININFLSAFIGRSMESETVSPFGAITNLEYYGFCFYMLLMFLIPCLFIENGCKIKYGSVATILMSKGISPVNIFLFKYISVVVVFTVLNVPLACFMYLSGIFSGIGFFDATLMLLLLSITQSVFCYACIWIFNEIRSAGISIFLYQLVMFFFSGGILPLVFLPDALKKFSVLTPNYYLMQIYTSLKADTMDMNSIAMLGLIISAMIAATFFIAAYRLKKARV